MAVKINNIEYSGFFYNGEALTAMYLNGNKVFSKSVIPPIKYKTYRQVEWISNEDLANNNIFVWLNLGYQWNTKSKAVFEMQEVNYTGSQYWGTSGGVSDNGDMRFFRVGGTLYMDVGSKRIQKSNTKNSNFHVGECGNYYFTFNGSTGTGTTYTNADTSVIQSPIGLFCSAKYKDSARFKYFQIYEDDELIMDIVPVLDENDIPMFLDKISGKEIAYKVNGEPSTGLTAGNATGATIKIVYSESSVTISNDSVSGITVGNTFNLNASVVPTGSTLTYTSSNPLVASVDSNGIVSGIASGSTTITITASEYVDDENRIVYRSGTSTVSLSVEEVERTRMFEWVEGNNVTINGDSSSYSQDINFSRTKYWDYSGFIPFSGGGNLEISYNSSTYGEVYVSPRTQYPPISINSISIVDINNNGISSDYYTIEEDKILIHSLPEGQYKLKFRYYDGKTSLQGLHIRIVCTIS